MNNKIVCETHKVPMISAGITRDNAQRFVCVTGGCVKEIGFGTISRLLKGYGFIDNGSGKNVFFHFSELPLGLKPQLGLLLKFEIGRAPQGPVAINIEQKRF